MVEKIQVEQIKIGAITKEVNRIVRDIIIDAPHYGLLMASVNRFVDYHTKTGRIPVMTAGVYKEGIHMFMTINPIFWTICTPGQRKFLLLHEMLHICFMHPTGCWRYLKPDVFNIAADIEINQHVEKVKGVERPPGGAWLETFGWQNDPNYKEKGSKFYYDQLIQEMENNTQVGQKCQEMCDAMGEQRGDSPGRGGQGEGEDGEGEGGGMDPTSGKVPEVDGHPTWKEFKNLSESESNLIEGQAKRQMAAVMKNSPKHCGNLPGYLRDMIDEILNPKPTYNWKAIFRRLYTGYADTTYLKKTRKRESIRFPGMPAVKIKKHSRVLCAIDTSGSISSAELIEFFNEVDGMRRAGVEIIVVECDTHIQKPEGVYTYRSIKTIEGRTLTGGGGTDFNDPIRYLNERANMFNMLIYLTDGYASVPTVRSVKPIVWVLSRNGKTLDQYEEYPGFTIKIKDPDE